MKLQGDYDGHDSKSGFPVVYMAFGVIGFMALILAVVLMNNKDFGSGKNSRPQAAQRSTESEEGTSVQEPPSKDLLDGLISGSTLTADDLDIWDMYPEEETEEEQTEAPKKKYEEEVVEDPAEDGKHTKLKNKDGTEEWVLISPYLTKNTYDFTQLVSQNDRMKYYENGKQISHLGVDISKYQEHVDFQSVKSDGIDFVMLRVGSRGYSTGQMTLDEYFDDNLKRATEAGLQIGVYFYSQAVNEQEAVEEANLVLEHIREYEIDYPVAFMMEEIPNDKARIDELNKNDKTAVAKAFLDTVKAAGYLPMVYGSKEWLIRQVDLSKLSDYDIWLSQNEDIPDYPYRFSMWNYSTQGSVAGITGYANLNISFIDYSAK